MYLDPLAPHGDPVRGAMYRCGRCAACPRYWRLNVPSELTAFGIIPTSDNIADIRGVHFLRRYKTRLFVTETARHGTVGTPCWWKTDRVHNGGAWVAPEYYFDLWYGSPFDPTGGGWKLGMWVTDRYFLSYALLGDGPFRCLGRNTFGIPVLIDVPNGLRVDGITAPAELAVEPYTP